MAYVSDPNQDQPAQAPQGGPAPVSAAPSGAGKPTGQASSAAPGQPFTNLNAYLTANAPQIESQAATVAGGLTNQYGQIQNDVNAAAQGFGDQVKAGYTAPNPTVVDAFNMNPTAVAADPTQAKAFTEQYGDQYKGPASFENSPEYASASGAVQKGVAAAKQVGTAPGLQSYFSTGRPTYTRGQATLDAALLKGNPQAEATIGAAAAPFTSLPGYLGQITAGQDKGIADARTAADAARGAAQGALSTRATGFATDLQGRADAATKARDDYNTRVAGARTAYDPLVTALKTYGGATGMPVDSLYKDVTALQPQAALPSAANVATQDDYGLAAALAQLAGGQSPVPLPIDAGTAGQAGTYAPAAWTLPDVSAGALTDAHAVRDNEYNGRSPLYLPPAGGAYESFLAALAKIDPSLVQSGNGYNVLAR